MLLRIQAKRQCFFGFPHPFQDESFKRLRNERVKSEAQMQNDGGLSRRERELRNYQTVGGIRKLGEESGDELESVFELARIDGVPNGSDTPLRYPAGQPELGRHERFRFRVSEGWNSDKCEFVSFSSGQCVKL